MLVVEPSEALREIEVEVLIRGGFYPCPAESLERALLQLAACRPQLVLGSDYALVCAIICLRSYDPGSGWVVQFMPSGLVAAKLPRSTAMKREPSAATELQTAFGMVRWVHVIPSVELAAMLTPIADRIVPLSAMPSQFPFCANAGVLSVQLCPSGDVRKFTPLEIEEPIATKSPSRATQIISFQLVTTLPVLNGVQEMPSADVAAELPSPENPGPMEQNTVPFHAMACPFCPTGNPACAVQLMPSADVAARPLLTGTSLPTVQNTVPFQATRRWLLVMLAWIAQAPAFGAIATAPPGPTATNSPGR